MVSDAFPRFHIDARKAKQAVDWGEDVDLGSIQICQVCGYTVEGDAPERCPICKALREEFKSF